jgi:hypothetical protein
MKRVSLLLALSLVWALPASAQVHGGNLGGSIKDQQAGVLPGATVTVSGVDATQSQTTAGDGSYHFLNLAPGSYQLRVALTGFATAVSESVIIEVGKTIDVSVVLSVATVNEAVRVNAAAPMVNATPVGTAINFTHDELTSIPTSRDPFALIRAVPGALTDRVNVGGNETGQQLVVLAKGARQQDTSWTLDGVEITDMSSPGQSATYFNFDNFDEIHVSTAGNDIRERTGALTIDLSVKRGGNQLHGSARGYFSDDSFQASNIPDELKAMSPAVTADKADHLTRSSDYGFDIGGPLFRNRAWFYASYSTQNIQVYRRTTNAIDRTTLNDPNVKINAQATSKDMVSLLWYNGVKVKDNRAPALSTFEQAAATWHQENQYADNPLHGLWKIADDHIFNPHLFVSAKYAYFNTGIALTPEGGMDAQAGANSLTSTSYGSVQRQLSARPQHTATIDANTFFESLGLAHNVKFGSGFRRVSPELENEWPGNMIKATVASSPTATVYREGHSASQINYVDFYVGDTITRSRATIDLGLRYDQQWGKALPSSTAGNPAFPSLVPGIAFSGYGAPFTWKNFSPRAGLLLALDDSGKTTARIAYSQFAGQLAKSSVDYVNPTATAGGCQYPWTDTNGDGFAQADEVNTSAAPACGGGFNAANPTAVTSTSKIDPSLSAPVTRSIVGGFERELMPSLAAQLTYTYSRTSNLFGDSALNITPRVGVPLSSYTAGPVMTGTLPDGSTYNVQTYVPNGALISANGGTSAFLLANIPGYYTDYNGVELGVVKRLSHRWMGRASIAFNNAREHFTDPAGKYDTNGNPMPTVTEPLVDGGQFAPATANGGGAYYLNAKWQVNLNAMYQAPQGVEVAVNVFGRQGYPFPIYRTGNTVSPSTALKPDDTLNVLVSPQVDTFRYPNVWDTDVRLAKEVTYQGLKVQLTGEVFNLLNANTALLRVNSITALNFNALSQNLSPRVMRVGVMVGF